MIVHNAACATPATTIPHLVRVLAAGNLQVERSSLHGLGTALQKAVGDVVMAVLVKVRCAAFFAHERVLWRGSLNALNASLCCA